MQNAEAMGEVLRLQVVVFFFNFTFALIFSQDVTEEDIEAELAIIHGQMAYIMQLQGRTEDALQLYNQIIKLK